MYHHRHIHFMGIGGIGMSGIALVLAKQGYCISGCDLNVEQKSVKQLQQLGCAVTHGHASNACFDPSIDILVYSSAIQKDHPEMVHARARGIPVVHRAAMLAELMRTKFNFAVAGAHGKTTTSSLISHILLSAQYDPTVIVGGRIANIDSNAYAGNSNLLVAETDESDRSFLQLPITWAIITNIDREHLDVYHDLDDIVACFTQFAHHVPFYGKAIICMDDPVICERLLPALQVPVVTYGLTPTADFCARHVVLHATHSTCTVVVHGKVLGTVHIPIAGEHMVLNTLAAIAATREIGVPFAAIAAAIQSFQGVDRRFTFHGTFQGAEVFDDYGHHPAEIARTLAVARKRAGNKLHVVFQPHRFTRTYHLWQEFLDTFAQYNTDTLVITDIYPASEAPIPNVTSQRLASELKAKNPQLNAQYLPLTNEFSEIIEHLKINAQPGDLILCLGAGSVYQIPDLLLTTHQ